jgi:hypothetical protein
LMWAVRSRRRRTTKFRSKFEVALAPHLAGVSGTKCGSL